MIELFDIVGWTVLSTSLLWLLIMVIVVVVNDDVAYKLGRHHGTLNTEYKCWQARRVSELRSSPISQHPDLLYVPAAIDYVDETVRKFHDLNRQKAQSWNSGRSDRVITLAQMKCITIESIVDLYSEISKDLTA